LHIGLSLFLVLFFKPQTRPLYRIRGFPIIFARQETRRTHFHDFFFGVGVVVFGCVGFFGVLVFLMCWFFWCVGFFVVVCVLHITLPFPW